MDRVFRGLLVASVCVSLALVLHVVVASSLFEWVYYPNPLCEFCGTEVLIYKPTGEVVYAVGESDNQVENEPFYMLYITISYIVPLALCLAALFQFNQICKGGEHV